MRATLKATCAVAFGAAGLVALSAAPASADEPVAASEPRLLNETAEVTSVVDAFDEGDPFDLHLTVGFMQTWKNANIRRETSLDQPGLTTGNFTNRTENIAAFSQSISTLDLGADIGIYKDLALIIRLPVILSDSQQLTGLDGSDAPQVQQQRLADPSGQGQLFSLPFKSPTRSGVDWFSVGMDWAIFNQMRDDTKPTWVVGVEGRFGVGTPLHACSDTPITISNPSNPTDNKRSCPDPTDPTKPDRDPGISRAMNSIGAHTVFSRRFGYVEPFSGFWFLAEFPQDRGDFGATDNFQGALVNHPPLVGTFALGMEVIPWERREEFQRLVGSFRVSGTYHSPGREYSELFDALGASQAPSLRSANPGAYTGGPGGTSVADPSAQKVYFTGITDQQAYGSLGAQASATWQAGEYVKFTAGLGYQFNQSHAITSADSCNPDFTNDATKAGPCLRNAGTSSETVTGIPNPNHRDSIDLPGRRFSADDTSIYNLWIMGVVMF